MKTGIHPHSQSEASPAKTAILTGPTATGKTQVALELAATTPGIEIINADSMLVYQGLNIGTAKPSPEELSRVHHHLIDLISPDQTFTAAEFARQAREAMKEIQARGNRPLIVGGTGFYLKALLYGVWNAPPADPALREALEKLTNEALFSELQSVDPTAATRIGLADRYRLVRSLEIFRLSGKPPTQLETENQKDPDPQFEIWIIDRTDDELSERIRKRTAAMVHEGIIEEFQSAYARYPESRALKAIGYAQVADYLAQRAPQGRKLKPGLEGLCDEIQLATRQLVKSQRTWFKSFLTKVPHAKRLILEQDRALLAELFAALYR